MRKLLENTYVGLLNFVYKNAFRRRGYNKYVGLVIFDPIACSICRFLFIILATEMYFHI